MTSLGVHRRSPTSSRRTLALAFREHREGAHERPDEPQVAPMPQRDRTLSLTWMSLWLKRTGEGHAFLD